MLVLFGLVAGLHAEEIILLNPNQSPAASRLLSFPSGQYMGNLYLEPESGAGWDLKHVGLSGQWKHLSAAQGDVHIPEGRKVKLWVRLALGPRESAKLLAQNPKAHQQLIADRTRKHPHDLSGLLELDPSDLFWLSVSSPMYLRAGVDPRMFEPIRLLTGLRILTLSSTGITDKGLEYLRSLHSLRCLELTQTSIGSRGLAVLRDLPALEYLLLNTGVTDAGLKQVAQFSNLRLLRIVDGKMWGPGLAELGKLPRLERLCIHQGRGQVSDQHIKKLEGLTQLKGLTLWGNGCDTLTDASLASIGKLRNLEELHFIRTNPKFTPAGVAPLRNLKNLKKVDFAQAWATLEGSKGADQVVLHIAALSKLESIKGIPCLSAEGMKTLTALRTLKCLHVTLRSHGQGYDGATGLSHLAGLRFLEELGISSSDTTLSEADLVGLEPLSRLRDLHIGVPGVTHRGLASIGKLKQLESLGLSMSALTCIGLSQLSGLSNLRKLDVSVRPRRNAAETDPADELILDLSGLRKMKDMRLSGLPLQDSDLAFLKHLPLIEYVMIHSDSALTGAFLRHLRELPELISLSVSGLSGCTGEDLAHLNGLPKLRGLTVTGDINNGVLASLTGPPSLESIRVETNNPIRRKTVSDLKKRHPMIEFIHIEEPWKPPTRAAQQQKRTGVSQGRINRRTPAQRRRERR